MSETMILKALVGSRAHGLERPESDYDYRGVFVLPTREFHTIGTKPKSVIWIESDEDNTAHEIGEFLNLALKSNPSILETLASPKYTADRFGMELRLLFDDLWTPAAAVEAFTGYSKNQMIKFFDGSLPAQRRNKFAVAWLRSLWQCRRLLDTGYLPVYVDDQDFRSHLRAIKEHTDPMSSGLASLVVRMAEDFKVQINEKLAKHPDKDKKPDPTKANEFLWRVRQEFVYPRGQSLLLNGYCF